MSEVPGAGWSVSGSKKNKQGSICGVDDLPAWHFQHRGIKNGYRCCQSATDAFFSLFYWHNESINIWMHYIACALVLVSIYINMSGR